MTTTTDSAPVAAEVQEFLAAVRAQLADLDADEQRDILDGLEADLSDLVAERGRGALGDPVAYARELRAAAGLEPDMARTRERVALSTRAHTLLDIARREWDRLVSALPGDVPGLLTTLQPILWVLRGWIAVEVAALWLGDWSLTVVPGGGATGVAAALVGIALSVQLGRGRLWPTLGWRRVAALRVLVLVLNVFALVMIPVVVNGFEHGRTDRYERGFQQGFREGALSMQEQVKSANKAGLYLDGTWVSNIYPYDAQGRPLVGVQLFNQVGKPINVITQPEYPQDECIWDEERGECLYDDGSVLDSSGKPMPRVYYPWTNGATQLFNVFPIPSRVQEGEALSPTAFAEDVKPTIGALPLESVPKVSLPGIMASMFKAPKP